MNDVENISPAIICQLVAQVTERPLTPGAVGAINRVILRLLDQHIAQAVKNMHRRAGHTITAEDIAKGNGSARN